MRNQSEENRKHSYGGKGATDVTLEAEQARGEKEQSTVGNEDDMSGFKYRFFIPKMVGSQPMTDTRWRKQKRSTDCSEQSDEEKVLRRDNELKTCGDGAQWQFNVEEKPEELEYWTANQEEDGYETAIKEEFWEKGVAPSESTMDVADADLDGDLKEFGTDCPLQSRCSYIDDDLLRDAAIWKGTVEFDEMENGDSNDEVSMRSQELKLSRGEIEDEFDSKVVGEDDRRWSCGEEWTSGGSYNPNCNDGPEGLSDQDGEHYMIRMENDAECQLMGMEQRACDVDVHVLEEPCMETNRKT